VIGIGVSCGGGGGWEADFLTRREKSRFEKKLYDIKARMGESSKDCRAKGGGYS